MVLQGRLKGTAAEGMREAVQCGMGLGVCSEWAFSPELRSGKLVTILEDWALPPTNLSAVYPTGRLASTKARAFVSFIERLMGGLNSVSPQRERAFSESVQEEAGSHTRRVGRAASVDDRVAPSH